MSTRAKPITIDLPDAHVLSGLLMLPAEPAAALVLAHGAGAGMDHPFMAAIAQGLAGRGIATLRFQFPYMDQGSRRPDPPRIAQAAVRAAVRDAASRLAALPLFAGGKSFGGRMTTQAQAADPLPGVRGIVLLGFPLHAAGKPSAERAAHLEHVQVPMLFVQGTRDTLAEQSLMAQTIDKLGRRASSHWVEGGDHSFHVLARSGRTDAQVLQEMLDGVAAWIQAHSLQDRPTR